MHELHDVCFHLFQEQNVWHDPVLSEPDPVLRAREVCVCHWCYITLLSLVFLCTSYTWDEFAWIDTHLNKHLWDFFTRGTFCCMMISVILDFKVNFVPFLVLFDVVLFMAFNSFQINHVVIKQQMFLQMWTVWTRDKCKILEVFRFAHYIDWLYL